MSGTGAPGGEIRFGPFALDIRTGELCKGPTRRKVPDQSIEILKALLERPGELVTREELRARLWSSDTFVDFEHGLNAAVRRLREALGDSADTPVFIETLPRRGYRFIGVLENPQTIVDSPGIGGAAGEEPASAIGIRPHPRRRSLAAALGLIIGASGVVFLLVALDVAGLRERVFGSKPLDSVAVLPFVNTTGDVTQDYIAAAIGDQIGVDLGAVRSLRVLSGQATESYEGSTKSPLQIGRELNVACLLEGSSLVVGRNVRITVRLVEASSRSQLWADVYDGNTADLLNLSKQITRAVVRQVQATLTARERERIDLLSAPVDPAVIELVHAGRTDIVPPSVVNYQQKRRYLERAIELDPGYAPAHASLAAWHLRGLRQGLLGPPADEYAAARKRLAIALKLDPESAEAHVSGALLALMADWDWEGAESHYRRAAELAPNRADVHSGLRYLLTITARYDEALAELRRWHELNPLETTVTYPVLLAWHYLALRQNDRVTDELDRHASQNPRTLWWRSVAAAIGGRPHEARSVCETALSSADVTSRQVATCGFAFGRIGDRARSLGILEELRDRSQKGQYIDPFLFATIEAGLQNTDQVFAHLRQAATEHSPLVIELTTAPWFDPFHEDPRYKELVRRIGFPQHRADQ